GILDLVLPSLIVPTCEYVLLRRLRRGRRPLGARLAAWVCLWVGQLAVLMLWVAIEAADWAHYWVVTGHVGLAILFGVGTTVAAIYLLVLALRVFGFGVIALGQATDDVLAARATALLPRALVMALVAGSYWFLFYVVRIPDP